MENCFSVWRVTYICDHVTQAQILPTSSKHVSVGMQFLGLGIGGLYHQSCMSLHIGTNNIVGGSMEGVFEINRHHQSSQYEWHAYHYAVIWQLERKSTAYIHRPNISVGVNQGKFNQSSIAPRYT